MAVVHGKGGAVKLGTGAGTAVLALNEWRMTSTADEVDVTAFGATDKAWLAGFKDGQITFSGFYDPEDTNGQAALHTAFAAGSQVHIKLLTNTEGDGFSADAIILSREVGAAVNGAVTCNFGLRANGAITPVADTP